MENHNAIHRLNSLLKINNARIVGYESAAKETDDTTLKDMFNHFIQTSRRCRAELVSEIRQLGGVPTDSSTNSGKFFRVWMDVKPSLNNEDLLALLDSCEYGEEHALRTYDEILNDEAEALNDSLFKVVRSQYDELSVGFDTVRSMQEAYAA